MLSTNKNWFLYGVILLAGILLLADRLAAETVNYSSGVNVKDDPVGHWLWDTNSTVTITGGDNTFNGYIGTGTDVMVSGGETVLNNSILANVDIVISGGSLLVGNNNLFIDYFDSWATDLTMSGGSFKAQGNNVYLKSLTLTGDATIDLGGGSSIFEIGSIQGFDSGHTLTFTNYAEDNSILFSSNDTALTNQQLSSQIFFGSIQSEIGGGEIYPTQIAPVPEPSTLIGLGLVLGFVFYRERKRIKIWYATGKARPAIMASNC